MLAETAGGVAVIVVVAGLRAGAVRLMTPSAAAVAASTGRPSTIPAASSSITLTPTSPALATSASAPAWAGARAPTSVHHTEKKEVQNRNII